MLTESMVLAILATLFGLVGVSFAAAHIDSLWRQWKGEHVQLHIVAICLIVPVWILLSWFCVIFPHRDNGILVLVDTYEAFVVFNFIEMMKEYLGGYHAAARKLKAVQPFRLLRCLCLIRMNDRSMFIIQALVYQFCILKPFLSFLRAFLEFFEFMDTNTLALFSGNSFLMIARLLSIGVAMVSLLIFYRCCSKTLSRYNVVMKFAVIKVLITLHLVQGLLFRVLITFGLIENGDETPEVRATRIQYLLVVIEMTILAFCLPFTYPARRKGGPNGDLSMDTFKLVSLDVPRAFDARSVDTFMEGTRDEAEEEDDADENGRGNGHGAGGGGGSSNGHDAKFSSLS